jgi:hypothetical protein
MRRQLEQSVLFEGFGRKETALRYVVVPAEPRGRACIWNALMPFRGPQVDEKTRRRFATNAHEYGLKTSNFTGALSVFISFHPWPLHFSAWAYDQNCWTTKNAGCNVPIET